MKKRNIRGLFIGEKGQRTFNFIYSLGASVVILGALFKLLHVPGADLILVIGMGTEAAIFALSAFDTPAKDYKWERVYPELAAEDEALERLERMRDGSNTTHVEGVSGNGIGGNITIIGGGVPAGGTVVVGGGASVAAQPAEGTVAVADQASLVAGEGVAPAVVGGGMAPLVASGNIGVTPEQADQVTEATRKYVEQLNAISEGLSKLQESMESLCQSNGYAEQMAALNKNVQGLNTIYEIQLKSVSSQLGTIEQVNQGLNNIRSLYESGQNDSFRIRQETDQLARNLQQLNEVYARMLQAMTIGYGFAPQSQPAQPQQFQQPQSQPAQPQQFQQPQSPLYAQR